MARDPRFDDLSGDFREETFDKNYEFLSDIKEREKQVSSQFCNLNKEYILDISIRKLHINEISYINEYEGIVLIFIFEK